VLVTDGEQRAALAAVRSLGSAGYRVHVCSGSAHSIAGTSRYRATETRVSDPLADPTRFVDDVRRLAVSVDADVLLPVSEASLLAILPAREQFDCAIPFASADSFDRICDKRQVLQIGRARGIAVPIQFELNAFRDDFDGRALRFPVVVKPSRSVSGSEVARIRNSVSYANDEAQLRQVLSRMPTGAYPLLLQQRVVGPGVGLSILIWDGEVRAAFAHRRIREKPPSGGVSVVRESIPLDGDLLERSVQVLNDLQWQGVAMLEYKYDSATGIPYLMEINGRLWGSLQLAIDSGVDFPVLLVRAALDIPSRPIMEYSVGVKSRWEWGDFDNLLAVLFQPTAKLALPSGRPNRVSAIGHFIRTLASGTRAEVFRLGDPLPFLRESVLWLRGK
jgi:predicted ATP-grasp superfamily ATP-dependent carboligase